MNTISNSMETNMTTSEILSLYNIGKDILVKSSGENVVDLLSMQRLYLNGYDAYIYDQSMDLNLYNYVLYDESLNEVTEAMKINLGLVEPKMEKEFKFSIDKPYEETVIGKNTIGKASVTKLPDFTGDTEAQAKATCNKLGISVNFKYVTIGSGTNNTVIAQSYKAGYDMSYVKSITLTVLKKEEKTVPKKEETTKKENEKVDSKEEPKVEQSKPTEKEEIKKEEPEELPKEEKTETNDEKDDEVTLEDVTGTE